MNSIPISRINQTVDRVNALAKAEWSDIISFSKPRIIAIEAIGEVSIE